MRQTSNTATMYNETNGKDVNWDTIKEDYLLIAGLAFLANLVLAHI
jgi:hypothetical protein